MAEIRVIIGGKVADLPPNGLNLPLTYSIKGKDGIAINTGSRSEYAFELPSTKQNDDIFNRFYDVSGITINQQKFISASIEVDGIPFFIGKCQLQAITLRQDIYSWTGKAYKIAFYGNNSDWAIQISNVLLKNLAHDDFTYTRASILADWNNTYPADDYKCIILKLRDYTTFGQIDPLDDCHPALFIVPLLHKIFNSIGYTLQSNFFSTAFAKKLIMPIPILNKYLSGLYGEEYLNVRAENSAVYLPYAPNGVTGGSYLDNQTYAPPNPPNPYDITQARYVIPADGYYLVKNYTKIYDISFTAPAVCCFFLGFVTEDGAPVFDWFWGDCVTVESEFTFERVVYKTAGQILEFGYIGGGDSISSPLDYYKVDWKIEVIGEAEIVDGLVFNLKYLLPDWKAIDFIKGLAHAFNLVFETDEGGRKVYIEPSDDYLIENRFPNIRQIETGFYTGGLDLTEKVDLSKGGELESDTKQLGTIKLKWKSDNNDPTAEALEEGQNLGLFQSQYSFPTDRYKKGETVIENPFFAATVVISDQEPVVRDISNAVVKIPIFPIVWKENYIETSTSSEAVENMLPRLLVSELQLAENNGIVNVWTGVLAQLPAPLAYMLDYNDTKGYQTSLAFNDAVVNGFSIAGMMKRFYLSEMARLQGGKYLEIFMLWNLVDVRNLSFRDKIIINGDRYLLQEINSFNVAKNQSTKTFLKYDFKAVGLDANIDNSIIIVKVNSGRL